MIVYNRSEIQEFFKIEVLPTFQKESHQGLLNTFEKNLFEIKVIVDVINSLKTERTPVVIDFGCGLGINLMILSKFYQCKCIGIDRYEEFDPTHNREVGSTNQVIERLNSFGVNIVADNPVTHRFDEAIGDIATSFDVIEHFNFPPTQYLNNMIDSLNMGGYLLVGTPNQAHIFNRIKLLFGYNVWEDFQYWLNYNPFYGHVRELLTSELKAVIKSVNLDVFKVYRTSYPIFNRLRRKFPVAIASLISFVFKLLFKFVPNYNYYNLVVAKKEYNNNV